MYPNPNSALPVIAFDGDPIFDGAVVPANTSFGGFTNLSFQDLTGIAYTYADVLAFIPNIGTVSNGNAATVGAIITNPNNDNIEDPVIIDYSGVVLTSVEAYAVIPFWGYYQEGSGPIPTCINARMLPITSSSGATVDSAEYVSFYNRIIIIPTNFPERDQDLVFGIALVNYTGNSLSGGAARINMQIKTWDKAEITFNPQK